MNKKHKNIENTIKSYTNKANNNNISPEHRCYLSPKIKIAKMEGI